MLYKKYSVSFYIDNDKYQQQHIFHNQTAQIPEDPVKKGFTFVGWYKIRGGQLIGKFDFMTQITEDTILKAQWTDKVVEIFSKEELLLLRNDEMATYVLKRDIDFCNQIWIATDLEGQFIGNGYTIKNIIIETSFIERLKGKIKDLNIENFLCEKSSLSNLEWAFSGLISYLEESGEVINCSASGNIDILSPKDYSINGDIDVGGLIGINAGGLVMNSFADISMNIKTDNHGINAGGLCGKNDGKIINCYATGSINALNSVYKGNYSIIRIGGLIGVGIESLDNAKNCYADVHVSASSIYGECYAGGFIGLLYRTPNGTFPIKNSFALGNIVANSSPYPHARRFAGSHYSHESLENCVTTMEQTLTVQNVLQENSPYDIKKEQLLNNEYIFTILKFDPVFWKLNNQLSLYWEIKT